MYYLEPRLKRSVKVQPIININSDLKIHLTCERPRPRTSCWYGIIVDEERANKAKVAEVMSTFHRKSIIIIPFHPLYFLFT